ncbi:FecR family protein [Halalkalibaculum sp. DA384]|uniref:FecR family protein n=1 Tax=Halalkalibaculum sp. DA384 TaxID=3373606 RepID=UPI0037545B31
MKNIDRKLIEKYFKDSCTREEAEQVLEWFNTKEGRRYLTEKLDADIRKLEETDLHLVHSELDSESIFKSIQQKKSSSQDLGLKKDKILSPIWRVAVILLIGLVGSLFFYSNYYEVPQTEDEANPTYYETLDNQQKQLTLSDGTQIRLNSNSKIWIPDRLSGNVREVRMTGEAYFDVAPNPDRPFVIHTKQTSIRVLGTAFNVKSLSTSKNVQVAVVEGEVSVSSSEKKKENSVLLGKGQFGYLEEGEFSVENFGIENYLYWMKGRLVFENLNLDQVCTQLSRLYEVSCQIEDEALRNLKLSTNVSSASSLEKVLSVISLSLDVNYRKSNHGIVWYDKQKLESTGNETEAGQERR